MVNRPIDAVAELQNAFQMLLKNWVLAVPTALVSLIAAILAIFMLAATVGALMAGGLMQGSDPSAVLTMLKAAIPSLGLFFIIIALLALVAQAIVIGGAEHVWHGQPADLSGGVGKAFGKLAPLIGLFFVALVLVGVCSLLALLFGLGVLVGLLLAFFFMFTMPAIVLGNEGVFAAMGTSWRLVRANMGPSALAFLGIVVIQIIGTIITFVFQHIPVIGILVSLVVGGLTAAYATLVIVRFYDLLRGQAA